jgi:FkbM family methyltransferase
MFYSQYGEDRLLVQLFAGKTSGICVEVGANNGVDGSTTLHFEETGWNCLLVEPNPALCQAIRARRTAQLFECAASSKSGAETLHIAAGAELAHAVSKLGGQEQAQLIHERYGFQTEAVLVKLRTLDDILEEAGVAGPIDFVSIDVEGHELEVLKGLNTDRWLPTVMIIEDNSLLWERAVSQHLRRRGYVRFMRTGVNDWYARKSDRHLATLRRRLGYYPQMLHARWPMIERKIIEQLARVPLLRQIRRLTRHVDKRKAAPGEK